MRGPGIGQPGPDLLIITVGKQGHLLDTNVISELRKREPDRNVLAWYDTVPEEENFLSVLTTGEIRIGVERLRRKDTTQAARLEPWLGGLHAAYRDHITGIDAGTAEREGRALLHRRPNVASWRRLLRGARSRHERGAEPRAAA